MSDRDAFKDRERGLEEGYFLKREQELIKKMRERVALEKERSQLADKIGVTNDEILQALQDLGYNSENIKLLHLMPLVHVAWANGKISDRERKIILEAARASGIGEGSEAERHLEELLHDPPSDEFMEAQFMAIRAILQAVPEDSQKAIRENLTNYCTVLASLSKELFSLEPRISKAEREALDRVIHELTDHQRSAVKKILENDDSPA